MMIKGTFIGTNEIFLCSKKEISVVFNAMDIDIIFAKKIYLKANIRIKIIGIRVEAVLKETTIKILWLNWFFIEHV